ncbi:MAG: glycosyltransferase family 2 protein [Anaerolineae bacterium]|nr:glycosyltransferase family 2 protein [Anaerolineae bacterium]
MSPDLAVVIVSWNTRALTLNALRTLTADLDAHGPAAQVWVVDCASADGTPDAIGQHFPQVTLIASADNLGFAAGNNLALERMGFSRTPGQPASDDLPRAVYFLNPDTETAPGATRALYDALLRLPSAGVVGAQLVYGDGTFQHGAFRFPGLVQLAIELFPLPARLYDSPLNGRYPRERYARGEPFPVDHTLGATMMVKREVIATTGMFDEGYFMYCEEIDWSLRIRRAGWQIYAVPAAQVVHLGGQSTGQIRATSLINLWRSRLRLFDRHYARPRRALARWLVRAGMRWRLWQTARAYRAGTLSAADREALTTAYRAVLEAARTP